MNPLAKEFVLRPGAEYGVDTDFELVFSRLCRDVEGLDVSVLFRDRMVRELRIPKFNIKDPKASNGIAQVRAALAREDAWNLRFAQMIGYAANNGNNHNVPRGYSTPGLGHWVDHQRVTFNADTMLAHRRAKFEELLEAGSWAADVHEANWQENFALVLKYRDENNGNANVPHRYSTAGVNLGAWVKTQRGTFNADSMPAPRRAKFQALLDAGSWRS